MKRIVLPSQEELHERFDYSIITGRLYYADYGQIRSRSKIGKPAGFVRNGRRMIKFNDKAIMHYRAVWKWITGEEPGQLDIDHIDADSLNDSWHNLRLVTHKENTRRTIIQKVTDGGDVDYSIQYYIARGIPIPYEIYKRYNNSVEGR